ncbi:ABC transporter substrate-binding protein [Herbiconiux daphne]|uniref:Extracellular solute-binding protein n=1 Tax=Herbiconiux daphne TaxID=2970914 RepID=A0ABT2H448_9MICO|nr:extracellular solute-binding protein [Herbiconiux daphne]MCS5734703.1 extracellular solute-binding protein [Herbiconiux daphne]
MAAQHRRPLTRLLATATAVVGIAALAGCSGGGSEVNSDYGFASAEQTADSTITVWVDAAREPVAKAFEEANPDVPISIETYDGNAGGSGSFQTKVALFDQSGEGWPDVVFSTQTNDASWAAKETNGVQAFAAPLNKGYLSDDFLSGFTDGANDPMTVDGTVYGLRNDLAPVVLWYNQKLLDEFGYAIPTTWEEYQALGDKLAAEHPGYILGSIGDSFVGTYVYYWGAQAPIFQLDGDTFSSDFDDDHSVAMTDMLDSMVANGTLVQDSVFSAPFVENYSDKIVAMPGPAWYAGALFQNPDSLNSTAGEIGAADPLYWEGEDKVTGNVGGGVWYASSHSKNLAAAKTFLEFVTSSDEAAALASGLPAYDSAASTWLDTQAESNFFTGDFKSAVQTAAGSVWGGWGFPSFSPETAYAAVVVPALADGKTIADVVPEWHDQILNEAQVQGYTVK